MCPRTLIDRKRKRYDNAVDVVVRLHDPTDPSTKRTTPPSSAHVQLDDDPRTPIQQGVGDEFPSARWCGDDDDVLPTQGLA